MDAGISVAAALTVGGVAGTSAFAGCSVVPPKSPPQAASVAVNSAATNNAGIQRNKVGIKMPGDRGCGKRWMASKILLSVTVSQGFTARENLGLDYRTISQYEDQPAEGSRYNWINRPQ